ncbi:MAG: helix-turn-helix domain-containing protein, partial [Candidatus Levybacteria bacterium]|nr:helix-turn-helix domain-containing protein [Candidatus Levybacteria bacterium]
DLTNEEKKKACYLWDTGMVVQTVFSPLLQHYLQHVSTQAEGENKNIYFSKKENTLFTLLQQNIDHICEREKIVEFVWPEYRELGVSDWAIDRLVARVRAKLKHQKSPHEIITIRTRGYKLVAQS